MAIDKLPSGRWRARWRETPGGPQLSATFRLKDEAKDHLAAIRADQRRGSYVSPKAGEVRLRDYVEEHLARQPWRPRTLESARMSLRHVLDAHGDRPIGRIRRSDLQALISGLDAAPTTVRVVAQHTRAVFRAAVRDGLILIDPSTDLKLPRLERGDVVPLRDDEVSRLYDSAPAPFRTAILLGAALGLRQAEASGLTVDRVDFLRRTVRVDRQWTLRYGWGPTKTRGSTRTIPVAEPVIELLAQHVERHGVGTEGVLIHWPATSRPAGPMGSNSWGQAMRGAAARADLHGVTFHALRHHAASRLIAAGLSVVAVARFLGHDSPSTTLRTYAHLWADDNDRIRSAMTTAWTSAESRINHGEDVI